MLPSYLKCRWAQPVRYICVAALLSILCIAVASSIAAQDSPPRDRLLRIERTVPSSAFAPGVILIQFRDPSLTEAQAWSTLRGYARSSERTVESLESLPGLPSTFLAKVAPGQEEILSEVFSHSPHILAAEPDYLYHTIALMPDDTLYSRYQWNLPHIRADEGWELSTGSSSIVIAVVDTGVDLAHPDLVHQLVPGYDPANGDWTPEDDMGHGTHVASIAAASSNNDAGVTGVAWNAQIMPIKVLDANGSGSGSNIARGITWAVDSGADIVNLSLGGNEPSLAVQEAIEYAYRRGVLVISAAGNQYEDGNPTTYPAAYDRVLAVAATDDQDGHASYSNSGTYVDVAAPGGDPTSAFDDENRHWISGAYWRGSGAEYAQLSGTSQAAPHVAGLAALLLSVQPGLSPDDLTAIVTGTAVDVQEPGWDEFSGHGRVDVLAALHSVQSEATATPTELPATITPTETPATPQPGPTPESTPTPPGERFHLYTPHILLSEEMDSSP